MFKVKSFIGLNVIICSSFYLPLQVIRVEQFLLACVGAGLQLLPSLVDLSLLAVGGVGGVTVRGHQAVGRVVQLTDLVAKGGEVALQTLMFA